MNCAQRSKARLQPFFPHLPPPPHHSCNPAPAQRNQTELQQLLDADAYVAPAAPGTYTSKPSILNKTGSNIALAASMPGGGSTPAPGASAVLAMGSHGEGGAVSRCFQSDSWVYVTPQWYSLWVLLQVRSHKCGVWEAAWARRVLGRVGLHCSLCACDHTVWKGRRRGWLMVWPGLFGVGAVWICCWPVGTASMANMAWEAGVALVLLVTPCGNSSIVDAGDHHP